MCQMRGLFHCEDEEIGEDNGDDDEDDDGELFASSAPPPLRVLGTWLVFTVDGHPAFVPVLATFEPPPPRTTDYSSSIIPHSELTVLGDVDNVLAGLSISSAKFKATCPESSAPVVTDELHTAPKTVGWTSAAHTTTARPVSTAPGATTVPSNLSHAAHTTTARPVSTAPGATTVPSNLSHAAHTTTARPVSTAPGAITVPSNHSHLGAPLRTSETCPESFAPGASVVHWNSGRPVERSFPETAILKGRPVDLPSTQGLVEQRSRPSIFAGSSAPLQRRDPDDRELDARSEYNSPMAAPLVSTVTETDGVGDTSAVVERSSHNAGKMASLCCLVETGTSSSSPSARYSVLALQRLLAAPLTRPLSEKQHCLSAVAVKPYEDDKPYEGVVSSVCCMARVSMPVHKTIISCAFSGNFSVLDDSSENSFPKTPIASSLQTSKDATHLDGNSYPKAFWENLDPLLDFDSVGSMGKLEGHLETDRRCLDCLLANWDRADVMPQLEDDQGQREE